MPLNRRAVLKSFLMSPFFGIASKLWANPVYGAIVKGKLNILVNGIFFMERLPDPNHPDDSSYSLLAIHAPRVTDHVFLAGTRGNLKPSTGFNWSTGYGLTGGSTSFDNPKAPEIPHELPSSVLQFTRKETGLGNFKSDASVYLGTVTLPWPKDIYALRLDSLPPFDQGSAQHPKNVAPYIKTRCGNNKIGDVLCLQYDCDFSGPVLPPGAPIMNVHLDMVCCKDSDGTVDHINVALKDSAAIFQQSGFDLNVTPVMVQASPVDPNPSVAGVTPEDERAAIEDGACPNTPVPCPTPQGPGSVSPANCPTFFVG